MPLAAAKACKLGFSDRSIAVARRQTSNPYELQTKWSSVLAAVSALCLLALLVGVLRHFDFEQRTAYYVPGSLRFFAILGAAALGLCSSAVGWLTALNAAGQKRNPLSARAWEMFFVHSVLIVVMLATFIFFWTAKEAVR